MIVHKGNHSYEEDRYLYTVDNDNLLYYLDNQSKIKFNKGIRFNII